MAYVLCFDIDDSLATEYYLLKTGADYHIHFRGELYNDARRRILDKHKHEPNIPIIITSFSARQSFYLERFNSDRNITIWSCQLLHALALQLSKELKIEIILDQSWLSDLDPAQINFQKLLTEAEKLINVKVAEFLFDDALLLAKKQGYLTGDEYALNEDTLSVNQQFIKTVRARQIIHSVVSNIKSPVSRIDMVLYDDRPEYLQGLQDMLAVRGVKVQVTTVLNNPYYMLPDRSERMLDKNVLQEIASFDCCERDLKNNFEIWPILPPKSAVHAHQQIVPETPGLAVTKIFLQQLTRRTKFLREIGADIRHRDFPFEKTILEKMGAARFKWGQGIYPAFPGN
jgi:hypothetical protein